MVRHLSRKSVPSGLTSLFTAARFPSRSRKGLPKKASRPRFTRLLLEPLEDRTLLSASISGTIFNSSLAGSPALAGQVVYLNQTASGTNTYPAEGNSTITPTTQLGADNLISGLASDSLLQAQGVPPAITDLQVHLDLTLAGGPNGASAPITVGIISPTGLTVPALAELFNIDPGETFDGTFDGNGAAPFSIAATQAAGKVDPTTTIQPQQPFVNANSEIYNGNPNGTWGLVFFADNPGDNQYLTLHSWSLTFTAPNISTVTDAQGNYSFTGLPAGSYTVSAADSAADVVTAAPQNATFNLSGDQSASGVNFSVQPAPDLTGVAFNIVGTQTNVQGAVTQATINYTLTNQGNGNADPFSVDLLLSSDGVITDSPDPLDTIDFANGLAAHASTSGSVTVSLQDAPASDYVGFYINSPKNAQGQTQASVTAHNSNQGAGIDLALLGGNTNQQLTSDATDSGVQQDPSIAVDPLNPSEIVVAYMDYNYIDPSGLNSGYAGIDIQYSVDGGTDWTTKKAIVLPTNFSGGASNPIVQFDNSGNFYVVFEAATFYDATPPALTEPGYVSAAYGFQSDNGIFIVSGAISAQGDLNLGAVQPVVENLYTGTPVVYDVDPDLAIDTFQYLPTQNGQPKQLNPNYGNLYVTWTRFYPAGDFPAESTSTGGDQIMFAVSKDGGATWTIELQANGLSVISDPNSPLGSGYAAGIGYDGLAHVTVGPQGDVYVSSFGGNVFTIYHSFNPGGPNPTFTAPDIANDFNLPFGDTAILPLTSLFTDPYMRTLPVRDIVADPTDPGRVYAVEATSADDAAVGGDVDAGEIVFAVSNDYGLTWQNMFTVGANATNFADLTPTEQASFYPVLNDDNGGNYLGDADVAQLNNAVIAGQALPSLAVDPKTGDLTVIWYDARTDPSTYGGNPGTLLSVFGTVSTDGGSTFSPNFEVATQNFNPYNGVFVDASPNYDDFLGDYIGVAASNGVAYAVWTATDGTNGSFDGQQHIVFDKYDLTPTPQAPADRFSPNNTMATATNIGSVAAQEIYSFLNLPAGGSNEWFQLTAGATGDLSVIVNAASGGNNLQVEVTDADGNAISTVSTPVYDSFGNIVGQQLDIASISGTTYYVHVSTPFNTPTAVTYTLTVETLTADLGAQVEGSEPGTVGQYQTNIYRLVAGVAGTLDVTLTANADVAGDINLSILGPDGQTVLATDANNANGGIGANGTDALSIQVTAGQLVFLQVAGFSTDVAGIFGNSSSGSGDFTLDYKNLDQYEASSVSTLFIPTVGNPSSITASTLGNSDGLDDLLYDSTQGTDALSVLKSNPDGTFQAAQDYDVGPGQVSDSTTNLNRDIGVADFTNNGTQDVIVPNYRAGDVSELLDNGAGGFDPQRIFNAVVDPVALVTGAFGNTVDGVAVQDAAVLQNYTPGQYSQVAILLGRGDGTFGVPTFLTTIFNDGASTMVAGDFGNGNLDIVVFSDNSAQAEMFIGNGDGTFQTPVVFSYNNNDGIGSFPTGVSFPIGEPTFNAAGINLNPSGAKVDALGNPIYDALVTTSTSSGKVFIQTISYDSATGTFAFQQTPSPFVAMAPPAGGGDVGVYGLAVTDFTPPSGLPALPSGMFYGKNNIVVTAQLRNGAGAAEVLLLPEVVDANGNFVTYGSAVMLADVGTAGNIAVGNFVSANETDLAVADTGGITVIYGSPLTLNSGATQNLGDADHVVTPPAAIVTGYETASYTYTVPTETVAGGGDQVIDFSVLTQYVGGAGLKLTVFDATTGQNLYSGIDATGSGFRFRVTAAQGDVLDITVSGVSGTGYGAYTLDIDVLPQVVSIQAESALPGAPATSLVLTLQGDNLDPTTAQLSSNYIVTWLGPDGIPGSADNQVVPSQDYTVVYDPDSNVAVAGDGLTYATADRQTITLTFDSPLPVGSYEITLEPSIVAAPYSTDEPPLVGLDTALGGHLLVSAKSGVVHNGSVFVVPNLVAPAGGADPAAIGNGTPFLTQLDDDLSAILNAGLQQGLSDAVITAEINAEIYARFSAMFGGGTPTIDLGVIWLDPLSLGVQAPEGTAAMYSLASNVATNNISQSYVSVGGNVEVVVLAGLVGTFKLDVGNIPADARGGAVVLDPLGNQVVGFTQALAAGTTDFLVNIPAAVVSVGQGVGSAPGQVASTVSSSTNPSSTASPVSSGLASTAQTANAILVSALLTGFPETSTGQSNSLGGNTTPTGSTNSGSTQNSTTNSTNTGTSASGGSEPGQSDGRSSTWQSVLDNAFLNLPDSVGGFIDLAGQLVQDGQDAAQILADRINAILKSQKPPAPMATPPESSRPAPESSNGQGNETRRQGDKEPGRQGEEMTSVVAVAAPMEEHSWRTHEYALTLFLASGLYYVGLRDLTDRGADSRKKRF